VSGRHGPHAACTPALPATAPKRTGRRGSRRRSRSSRCSRCSRCTHSSSSSRSRATSTVAATTSTARRRYYLEGLAVAPRHQRRGVGGALLAACERLGRLWGRPSLWLHVDSANRAALALYRARGYQVCASRGLGGRRYLMARPLQRLQRAAAGGGGGGEAAAPGAGAAAAGLEAGRVVDAQRKVFVWDAELK
jgi:hypothetical protein